MSGGCPKTLQTSRQAEKMYPHIRVPIKSVVLLLTSYGSVFYPVTDLSYLLTYLVIEAGCFLQAEFSLFKFLPLHVELSEKQVILIARSTIRVQQLKRHGSRYKLIVRGKKSASVFSEEVGCIQICTDEL